MSFLERVEAAAETAADKGNPVGCPLVLTDDMSLAGGL